MQPLFPELPHQVREITAKVDEIDQVIAELLSIAPQEIYCFRGDLGAGKTTLTKGFLKEIGIAEGVASPTFSLVTPYGLDQTTFFQKPNHKPASKSPKLYHHDWYRIQEAGELFDAGIEEILNEYPSVHVVEWPEVGSFFIRDLIENFQATCLEVQIEHQENQRLYRLIEYNRP